MCQTHAFPLQQDSRIDRIHRAQPDLRRHQIHTLQGHGVRTSVLRPQTLRGTRHRRSLTLGLENRVPDRNKDRGTVCGLERLSLQKHELVQVLDVDRLRRVHRAAHEPDYPGHVDPRGLPKDHRDGKRGPIRSETTPATQSDVGL